MQNFKQIVTELFLVCWELTIAVAITLAVITPALIMLLVFMWAMVKVIDFLFFRW